MQTAKQLEKIALIIDEEILDELGYYVAGELISLENATKQDDFKDLPEEDQIKYRFFFMHKINIFKRFEKILDIVFDQMDNPHCKRLYREKI